MKKSKLTKLQKAGWKVGTARDLLELTDEESALIEMKLALAENIKRLRVVKELSQSELASLTGSSQSRVAKMEAADPSVAIDLMIRTLLALGTSRKQLGKIIGTAA